MANSKLSTSYLLSSGLLLCFQTEEIRNQVANFRCVEEVERISLYLTLKRISSIYVVSENP